MTRRALRVKAMKILNVIGHDRLSLYDITSLIPARAQARHSCVKEQMNPKGVLRAPDPDALSRK
ncbi:hypothetical protein ABVT39_013933 [Epinephelus coioides]